MSKMITFYLGLVLLASVLPNQVHSSDTTSAKPNVTASSTTNSTSSANSSGTSLVTTSTNATTPNNHGDSLYASSSLFLSLVTISVLHLCH